MSILRLVFREIRMRWFPFFLGVGAVSIAVGVLVGLLVVVDWFELGADRTLEAKTSETEDEIAENKKEAAADIQRSEAAFNVIVKSSRELTEAEIQRSEEVFAAIVEESRQNTEAEIFRSEAASAGIVKQSRENAETEMQRSEAASAAIIKGYREDTHAEMIRLEAETAVHMKKLVDDARKDMLKLGFNLLLLPPKQQLGNFHAEGYALADMPEEYVTRLANSDQMTIQHLLPSLEQKVRWPEQGQRTILLIGTRGEVPLAHRDPKKPLLDAVEQGTAVVGHEIWDSLELEVGDKITLMEKEFQVAKCNAQRGSKDDITIWLSLAEAQELLGMEGRINGILAIKCLCPNNDIESIRRQVDELLPGVQVIEFSKAAATREAARVHATEAAQKTLDEAKATATASLANLIELEEKSLAELKAAAEIKLANQIALEEQSLAELKAASTASLANQIKLKEQSLAASKETATNKLANQLESGKETLTQSKANAKATRDRDDRRAKKSLENEENYQKKIRGQLDTLITKIAPITIVGGILCLGSLIFMNIRGRTGELGILQAIGYGGGQILTLLLARPLLIGVLGGILGCLLGVGIGAVAGLQLAEGARFEEAFDIGKVLIVLAGTPLVAFLVGLPAVIWASRQDPAETLTRDV